VFKRSGVFHRYKFVFESAVHEMFEKIGHHIGDISGKKVNCLACVLFSVPWHWPVEKMKNSLI